MNSTRQVVQRALPPQACSWSTPASSSRASTMRFPWGTSNSPTPSTVNFGMAFPPFPQTYWSFSCCTWRRRTAQAPRGTRVARRFRTLPASPPTPPETASMAPPPPHTNRLAHETSPYLRQHAHNPVDWYPWGPEALARAKQLDRPIFLSIGYSACHWCHVM